MSQSWEREFSDLWLGADVGADPRDNNYVSIFPDEDSEPRTFFNFGASSSSTSGRPTPARTFIELKSSVNNSSGAVPVVEFECRYTPGNAALTLEQVQQQCHTEVLNRLSNLYRTAGDINGLYSQVRLHQREDMEYDYTTEMLVDRDLNQAFNDGLLLLIISFKNAHLNTVDGNSGVIIFTYTFVLPAYQNSGVARNAITNDLLREAIYTARTSTLNSRQLINRAPGATANAVRKARTLQRFVYRNNLAAIPSTRRKVGARPKDPANFVARRAVKRGVPPTARVVTDPRLQAVQEKSRSSAYKAELTTRTKQKLTTAQKAVRNERRKVLRAQKKAAAGTTRGSYEDFKRRLFHHTSLQDFFMHSKAVMEVSNTVAEGYCLAMAFIRSECRVYDMETFEVSEHDAGRDADLFICPILPIWRKRISDAYSRCTQHVYFMRRNVDTDELEIVLFNPKRVRVAEERTVDGALQYESVNDKATIQLWYFCAQNLHMHVVNETLDFTLDPNRDDCLEEYAKVFGVAITIYRFENQGKRTNLYLPPSYERDVRRLDSVNVVSILIHDEHTTCITSLRDFLKSKMNANRTGVNSYCLICEKLTTTNNESIDKCKAHFKRCLDKVNGKFECNMSVWGDMEQKVREYTPKQFLFIKRRDSKEYMCRSCGQCVEGGPYEQMEHICQIQKPNSIKIGLEEEIYVYDFECAQILDVQTGVFVHKVNLVCVRKAYPDANGECTDRHSFSTLDEFMVYVLSFVTEKRIYLAHNGGKYDVQFVLRYLEKNLIAHTFIPSPSSMHAYLSVTVPFGSSQSCTFLDFRYFMPGSLKGIGLAFGLSVAKGDFPHHFNNGLHDEYEGPIPALHHESDYWCLRSKRAQEDVDEFVSWYEEQKLVFCTCEGVCQCPKRKWNFREQLLMYCVLDVDVLAEACVKYRNNALEFGTDSESSDNCGWQSVGIDPYQYLTIPQIAVNLLLGGMPDGSNLTVTCTKQRGERVKLAVCWMRRLEMQSGVRINHIGNSNKEYNCPVTNRFVDGYQITSAFRQVYVCLNCTFHGCKECFLEEIESGVDHPTRPGTYSMVHRDTAIYVESLMSAYGPDQVHIVWQHELERLIWSDFELECSNVMTDREMFYGGRTEVFSPYVNGEFAVGNEIKYHDVCSLYPYVCAFKRLPIGSPQHIFGDEVDFARVCDLNHPDPYFGFMRCTIVPNNTDIIGLLPRRDPVGGRLEFPLHEMTGSWGTEEIRLAIEHGYRVTNVYEVYHWTEDESSDTFLRGYVSFFLRMKQEAEGWKKLGATSDEPDDEEKEKVAEKVYVESGCIARIRAGNVAKNPVKRQMAKLFLNSLWGKFCQKPHKEVYTTINGYQQFAVLWNDSRIVRKTFRFRHLGNNTWKVRYETTDAFTKPNSKYNIFLSAKVTEHARCVLHRQMMKIGPERILYCDTDSIMFMYDKKLPRYDGVGLGNWVDEYPRDKIKRLFALAPKFYYLEFENEDDNLLKSKGIQMNLNNSKKIHAKSLGLQLLEKFYPATNEDGAVLPFKGFLGMENMIMGVNSTNSKLAYGTMTTRYTLDKKLAPVFSKRDLVPFLKESNVKYDIGDLSRIKRIYTLPKGYAQTVLEASSFFYAYL